MPTDNIVPFEVLLCGIPTLERPDVNRKMIEAGRQYIEEHLAWERAVKQVGGDVWGLHSLHLSICAYLYRNICFNGVVR